MSLYLGTRLIAAGTGGGNTNPTSGTIPINEDGAFIDSAITEVSGDVTVSNNLAVTGTTRLGITSDTVTETGQAVGVNTDGDVVTIDSGGGGPFYEEGTVELTWQDTTTSNPSGTVYYTRIGRVVHVSGLAIFNGTSGTAAVSIDDASLPWDDRSGTYASGSWSSTLGPSAGVVSNFDGTSIAIDDIKFTDGVYGNGTQGGGYRFSFTYQCIDSTDPADRNSTATPTT